ncbi:uncharacterized protein LOC143291140 [Babylonia areolata]|uniref:uncharacterized protein LOC143291140 n=1 Tax=Babylonia areolata TaxID=304850 RepID=UPI003FD1DD86
MAPRAIVMAGTGVVALAAILQIVGVATPSWISATENVVHFGLWRYCAKATVDGDDTCIAFPDEPSWLLASRAMGIVAIVSMLSAAGFGAIILVKPDKEVLGLRISPSFSSIGASTSIISFAIFAGKFSDVFAQDSSILHFDYSFGLCVAAAILSAIAGGLFVYARRAN